MEYVLPWELMYKVSLCSMYTISVDEFLICGFYGN